MVNVEIVRLDPTRVPVRGILAHVLYSAFPLKLRIMDGLFKIKDK